VTAALSDRELRSALDRALAERDLELAGEVERRPSPYRTSFPIEELRVQLEGRGPVRLGCKRLDWDALEPEAQLAKPQFLHDPEREPAVYRSLLPQAPAGPPEFFGDTRDGERHLLFFEWVEGRELFQVGERELWEQAARWLARFHAALAPDLDRHRAEARLVDHDAAFYRGWIERARRFAPDPAPIEWLTARHQPVVEALCALPRTVIHGEFYASNVLVSDERVAPVDWELAAAGPGLTDLAALVSGWPQKDREAIAAAYAADPAVPPFEARDLGFARLQVAVQWLGWAPPQWEPPEGQQHDWLGEAIELAEGLDL
jgi:thiamine kinase-like enzyme